eukprot:gene17322-22863_t
MTYDPHCWLDCLKLDKNGSDPIDCKVRPDEGLSAIGELSPGNIYTPPATSIFTSLIRMLADELGYDANNIIGAPYDWRLSPMELENRDSFFTTLKFRIETAVRRHRRPAIIMAHSMGTNLFIYFCDWLRYYDKPSIGWERWVRKHIWAYVGFAAPLLGAPGSLKSVLSGHTFGLTISEAQARELEITFSSTHFLNPRSTQGKFTEYEFNNTLVTIKSSSGNSKLTFNIGDVENGEIFRWVGNMLQDQLIGILGTPASNNKRLSNSITEQKSSNIRGGAIQYTDRTFTPGTFTRSGNLIIEENNEVVQSIFQPSLFSPDKDNSDESFTNLDRNDTCSVYSSNTNLWSQSEESYDICSINNNPNSDFISPRRAIASGPLSDYRTSGKMCPTAPQFHPRTEPDIGFRSPTYGQLQPTMPIIPKSTELDLNFQYKYLAPSSSTNHQYSSSIMLSSNTHNQNSESFSKTRSENVVANTNLGLTGSNRSVSPRQRRCLQIAQDYANSILKSKEDKSPAKSSKDKIRARYEEAIDGFIYKVRFKRAHRNFVLSPTAPRNIQPGMFVKVEADRGEDLGIVLAKLSVEDFEEEIPTAGYRGRGFSSGQGDRKYVLRLASPQEKLLITEKADDEEKVLQTIREKTVQRKLPMIILDAEYQFDRHKLTYFFEADRRIDFRELVSDLFSLYKTRIWMQQVDTSSLPSRDDLEMQLAVASGLLLPTATMGPSRKPSTNTNFINDPSTYLSRIALENTAQVEQLARGNTTYNVSDIGNLSDNASWSTH